MTNQSKNKLPKEWVISNIEDTCEVLDRLRKPISQKDRVSGKYPYYGATGIVDFIDDYIFNETLVLVGEDGAKWERGDKTGFIAEGKYWVNNHAHVLRVKNNILINYWLVYFLELSNLSDYITGTTVPKLNQAKLKSIIFPLPPIPEQKRIVAKIDSLFDKIDKAIALTEESLKQAENLLPAVLKRTFDNLKNENTKIYKLGDEYVCKLIMGQSPPSSTYNNSGIGMPFFQGKKEFGETNPTVVKYCTDPKKIAFPGDILMSVRAPVGPTNIADIQCSIGRGLAAIRPNNKNTSTEFLIYYFKHFELEISKKGKGSTFTAITKNALENTIIPIPKLVKQNQIIIRFLKADDYSKKMVAKLKKQLWFLKNLKSSILSKAFSGDL